MKLEAEFRRPEALQAALGGLGDSHEPEVFSAKPLEVIPEGPSRMSVIAFLCAVASGLSATLFVLWAQRDYPLVTGAMPINSLWPIGVISFELTMLGAVAGTVAGFLIEGGFLSRKGGPAAALDSEAIFLRCECENSQADELRQQLRDAGAIAVEEVKG